MPRTPLASWLSRSAAEASGRPEGGVSRRAVLAAGGVGAAGLFGATRAGAAPKPAGPAPRIVVVGAGLAGLTAAYTLGRAGYRATVVEAATRVGGRCWSYRNGELGAGLVAEHGGEFIDQNHTAIRKLAGELGLVLDNVVAGETNGTEPAYRFLGRPYSYDQATADLKAIWSTLHKDVSAAGYPTLFDSYTPRGRELDRTSLYDYIEQVVPGGHRSQLGQLLDVAYTIEYGADTREQSSLNLLYLLAYSGQGQLRIFGPSNEKYHVRGGNDLIVRRLADAVGAIVTGAPLQSLARNADGTWRLGLSGSPALTADHVVLTLPFSLLRQVDTTGAGFDAVKRRAIAELPMGTNSKLHLGFGGRPWRAQGCTGETYSDLGYQNTWEVTRAQPGTAGILCNYTGGAVGAAYTPAQTPQQHAARVLRQLDPVLPGIAGAWDGRTATLDHWPSYRWTLGSYSYWKVGQYTSFAGAEGRAVGTCHFAGEHTSQDFQGFLNGAVESGQRAAAEILAGL